MTRFRALGTLSIGDDAARAIVVQVTADSREGRDPVNSRAACLGWAISRAVNARTSHPADPQFYASKVRTHIRARIAARSDNVEDRRRAVAARLLDGIQEASALALRHLRGEVVTVPFGLCEIFRDELLCAGAMEIETIRTPANLYRPATVEQTPVATAALHGREWIVDHGGFRIRQAWVRGSQHCAEIAACSHCGRRLVDGMSMESEDPSEDLCWREETGQCLPGVV